MAQIQFQSNKVLFHGTVSFCATHCTCGTDTPTDPNPNINTCKSCASPRPCPYFVSRLCTPVRLKLTFTEPTYQTACLACMADGKSVKVVSGSIAGDKTLEQDPAQACRWIYTDNAPSLVVAGFDSADCTSTQTNATQVQYTVEQTSDGFAAEVLARFASVKGAEFLLFTATGTGLIDFENAVTLTGDSTFAMECSDYTERGGGRLGQGGTTTLSICPAVAPVCVCTNAPQCLAVSPVLIPAGIADFTYDALATNDVVYCLNTNTCEWRSATVAAGGVDNLQLKVKYYEADDVHAVQGCGYYLYLYAFDGTNLIEKGIYYHAGRDASGVYELFEDYDMPGLQYALSVSFDCDNNSIGPGETPTSDGPVPSPNCSGRTPKTRKIGFSAVQTDMPPQVGGCSFGSAVMGDGVPLNFYTLTQDPANASVWSYTGPGPGLYVDGVYYSTIYIELSATGTGHRLLASVKNTGAAVDPLIFNDDGTVTATSCCSALTFTNANTTYSCAESGILGTAYVPASCPE